MTASPRTHGLRHRISATLAGLVSAALVLSGCSIYDAPLPGGPDTGDDPMTIKVMFRDVLDLVPKSTVKVNDVTVGKVKAIDLKGYVAEVTIEVPGDVRLPDNARAEIRQTSLLGEKFVSLIEPKEPGSGKLADKDVIGLDRTGRNPEVEEVLGAMSLLLNGGGIGQLKTIFSELNNAMEGREPELRSALTQIRTFIGQLDQNKESIVATIENTNRLALEIRRNDGAIKSALDDIPDALRSVDSQRADLVKLLEALNRLSGVGVRVIRASKESTINSLRHLGPVLEGFAKAGDDFPKSFQVFLTYPFIDEAVGRDPQVARTLHMGDYTNLSVDLDINAELLKPLDPVCDEIAAIRAEARRRANQVADELLDPLPGPVRDEIGPRVRESIVDRALAQAEAQCRAPSLSNLRAFGADELDREIRNLPPALQDLIPDDVLDGIANGGVNVPGGAPDLPRAQLGEGYQEPRPIDPFGLAALGLDAGLGTMLLQGVAEVR